MGAGTLALLLAAVALATCRRKRQERKGGTKAKRNRKNATKTPRSRGGNLSQGNEDNDDDEMTAAESVASMSSYREMEDATSWRPPTATGDDESIRSVASSAPSVWLEGLMGGWAAAVQGLVGPR